MGFGISRRARSRKAKGGLRSLFGKAPAADEIGDRLSRIVKRMLGDAVTDVTTRRVTLTLHPDASPVRITVLPDGDLEVKGVTSSIGPGYHTQISELLAPVLAELDYVWDSDEPDPKAAMTAWLAQELAGGAMRIGIPAELSFKIDADVLTPMGPRDAAWRAAVIADPSKGADAFAWWDSGPGRAELATALLALWLRMPWREPLDDDERALMRGLDDALRAARKADRTLALPHAEWAELLAHAGAKPERIANARERAEGTVATIGYRRFPIEVEVDAWTFDLPGSFVGNFEDDRYWATDGDRLVELTTLATVGAQTSQALLDIAPPKHPVIAQVIEDSRRGRAECYAEGELTIVHGIMASTPDVAILTCKGKRGDPAWALAAWQSLRHHR